MTQAKSGDIDRFVKAYFVEFDAIKALQAAGYSVEGAKQSLPQLVSNDRFSRAVLSAAARLQLTTLAKVAGGVLPKQASEAADTLYDKLRHIWVGSSPHPEQGEKESENKGMGQEW